MLVNWSIEVVQDPLSQGKLSGGGLRQVIASDASERKWTYVERTNICAITQVIAWMLYVWRTLTYVHLG